MYVSVATIANIITVNSILRTSSLTIFSLPYERISKLIKSAYDGGLEIIVPLLHVKL